MWRKTKQQEPQGLAFGGQEWSFLGKNRICLDAQDRFGFSEIIMIDDWRCSPGWCAPHIVRTSANINQAGQYHGRASKQVMEKKQKLLWFTMDGRLIRILLSA
jgi:hypothetical protein